MDDYGPLRQQMVDQQLVARGIKEQKVLGAFLRVPREAFVPIALRTNSYDDSALPIGDGQTISQPYMVAIMTELLFRKEKPLDRARGKDKVLEIGTGSGYQAAILAELFPKVYTIERLDALSERARTKLTGLGYNNVEFIVGDGTEGYPAAAPFDGIIVTAACPTVPAPLTDQLAEGGRLVIPVGERYRQTLLVIIKEKGKLRAENSLDCVFVPLIGKFGWSTS